MGGICKQRKDSGAGERMPPEGVLSHFGVSPLGGYILPLGSSFLRRVPLRGELEERETQETE